MTEPDAAPDGPAEPDAPHGPDAGRNAPAAPHDPIDERDGLGWLSEAAVAAERSTGRHEETVEQARRHIVVRVALIGAGVFVLLLGLALLALPGPGLVVVALGLGLLASEIPFAARLLERVKRRLPQDADGRLPRSAVAMMVGTCTVATGLSLWWTFLRD